MGRNVLLLKLFTTLGTTVCLAAATLPASAQIYAWRDASGRLVLSDRPAAAGARSYSVSTAAHVHTTRPVGTVGAAYDGLIRTHAEAHGISPDLVRAIIQIESAFNPRAVSHKGAMGLMQLMPATATEFQVSNPFDPAENIRAGVAYFRRLLDRYDQKVELALAAYNAGPGAVDRYGQQVPPYRETRAYVRKIVSVTPIAVGPRKTIYKIVELVDGREVPRYSDRKPEGQYEVVTRR
jgi:soluble lytic murein transglycosylase-like protein